MTTIGGKIEQKGVHVFCSTNVSLHVFSYYGTVGAFTAIPLESLGNEYIFSGIDSNPYMGIVGTSDGTNVTVKFRSTCDYAFHQHLYKDGDTITFILNKNEVFQLSVNTMDYRHYRCDMVGSHIKSTAAVAVFSGSIYHQDASSHLVLQVPPPSAFTNLVILPRLVSSAAWKTNVRIIAAFSNTTLKTPKGVIILNSGEFKDLTFKAEQDAVIQSDKKVLVIHNCLFVPDGGFTSIVPGVDLYRKNYMIKTLDKSTSSDSPQQLVVTIVSHTESVHEVEINGAAPSEITWKHMTSVPYSVGVVELPTRLVYRVNSTDPILVRVHVYNARQTHGYVAGYKSTPVTHKVSEILKLQCLSQGYLITLDLSALDIDVQDSSHIFMTLDTCTGILQGTVLTFNIPYETCGTKVQEYCHVTNTPY
ncbi:uncharacterized protein LOC126830648 isoform X2 [Patella vulgata]|uniref:uncharacterized protein LOC126830648 isoform X2 n=1 Tax=Patella vulgata TaxID=6465 RepID=UPI00217FAD0F|nr:uncharacterized protein LOC126830648 isoform X2 [Patella vulgata]